MINYWQLSHRLIAIALVYFDASYAHIIYNQLIKLGCFLCSTYELHLNQKIKYMSVFYTDEKNRA